MPSRSSNRARNGTPDTSGNDDGSMAAEAAAAVSDIAGQVKTAASDVVSSVGDKAQSLVSGVGDEFEHVLNERKDESAERLRNLAGAVSRASDEFQDEFPLVASYVKRGASRLDSLAGTIKEKDGRELAASAGDVIRRRAGLIAGVMGVVGFAAVRLLMAQSPQSPQSSQSPRPSQSSAAQQPNGGGHGAGAGQEAGTSEDVQHSLEHLAEMGEAAASGDPGGVSPVAPGFEAPAETDEATSRTS